MPTRNTTKLKELIYGTLSGDAALEALLGGAGNVRHASPQQLSDYPLVVYSFIDEEDNPYEIDLPDNTTNTIVLIECFSSNSDTAQVDALTDRVYALLHGQRLSNTDVQVYSAYRTSKAPIFEPEIEVQKTESIYNIFNATF